MNNLTKILGIRIEQRAEGANEIQNILTRYGCSIKTRLGLHDPIDGACNESGLMILELTGIEEEKNNLITALGKLEGITVKEMEL
jgi:alcohol dehydrogenase YqhD (iron-dependent ADH family)